MFGWIMPLPLLMPVIVICLPPKLMVLEVPLATISVVIIASAAFNQLSSFKFSMAAGIPAMTLSTGNGSKMTPVENGKIWLACKFKSLPKASQLCLARLKPSSPVPALAHPVLTSNARIPFFWPKNSLHKMTGAAQKRLSVNTPAARLPSANVITSTSLRLGLRTCAMA